MAPQLFLYVADSVSPDVYRALMKELAQTLDKQFSGNSESRAAGMIINTMGWVENLGLAANTCLTKNIDFCYAC